MGKKLYLSKKILKQKYVQEQKSCRTIAKELGCGKSVILKYLGKYGISIRKNYETRIGLKFTPEWRSKISKNHADVSGKNNPMYGIHRFGETNPGWKGGKTQVGLGIRASQKYAEWRLLVFQRDNFICQECEDNTGGNLNADHIKPFSIILKENKIQTVEQAYDCSELWDLNNGRTLCEFCHKKTDTWGSKARTYKICALL